MDHGAGQRAHLGRLARSHLDHLGRRRVGQRIERFVAIRDGILERRNNIGFSRFGRCGPGLLLAHDCVANAGLRIGDVRHQCTEAANLRDRFETVVLFRHFLRGLLKIVFDGAVGLLQLAAEAAGSGGLRLECENARER